MQKKVLLLIQKFENLSDDIAKPRSFPVTRQKSLVSLVAPSGKAEEPIRPQTPQPTPTHVTSGHPNKAMVDIEDGLKAFKKNMEELDPFDEKKILALFMDILDLLIQLSSIDTDGLKAMKIKKDNCLMELKKCKVDLSEMVLNTALDNPENQQTPEMPEHPMAGFPVDDETRELAETEDTPKICESTGLQVGTVRNIMQRFERNDSQASVINEPVQIRKSTTNLFQDNEEESEAESDTTQCTKVRKMTVAEIGSEVDYFKEIVPTLDVEDFFKIESVQEQLEMLLASSRIHDCNDTQQDIIQLLDYMNSLKNDEISQEHIVKPSSPQNISVPDIRVTSDEEVIVNVSNDQQTPGIEQQTFNMALIDQQTLSQDFIEAEQNNGFVYTEPVRVNEPQVKEKSASLQVVDINIPGDNHLTESQVMLSTYRDILKGYLQLPKEALLNTEERVQKNMEVINSFKAHPDLGPEFEDLRTNYKVVLDFITEESFSQLFNENTNAGMNGKADNFENFHNLCAEIENYYPFVENISVEEPSQVLMLKENLLELIMDIKKFDVSFNDGLVLKQAEALKELEMLLKHVTSQI